jgi:translocation and assembly module TamB
LALGGQSLSFTSGTVRFTGAGIADPALDLQARATSGDTVASLAITGSVAAPKITLSSVPALPSDQVLARLLFGTGASQLSPLQIASLAAGLAQLSGAGAGLPDPVGALRQALGLSTLGMGNGGSSVTVGRYIGGVYVGAEQSTTGGGTRARVSYDLTKRLRLHASAGPGETSSALGATGQTSGESVGIGYHLAY